MSEPRPIAWQDIVEMYERMIPPPPPIVIVRPETADRVRELHYPEDRIVVSEFPPEGTAYVYTPPVDI